jgi:hypothetical protein
MSTLTGTISGYVVGDNLEVRRTVTDLTDAIAAAWLTIKRHAREADADAIVAKVITTGDVPGTGQIENAGSPSVHGDLRFDLTPADTAKLGAASWVYDVQIKLDDGTVYTPEVGTVDLTGDVTRSTTP